ncbi:MAG: acyltransferase family protein [Chthoniobacter sp.]
MYFADAAGIHGLQWVHQFAEGTFKPFLPYYGVLFATGMFIWMDRQALLSLGGKFVGVIAVLVSATQIAVWSAKGSPHPWIVPTMVWLVSCLVIRYAAWNPKAQVAGVVRKLGLITYPLYLIHFTVGVWIIRNLVKAGLSPLTALAISVMIALVLALIISTKGEPALRNLFRKFLMKLEVAIKDASWVSLLCRPGRQIGRASIQQVIEPLPAPNAEPAPTRG